MKRNDHLALAAWLVRSCPERWTNRTLRTAFYAGAILPDSNPATYLRGITQTWCPKGHNTECSYPLVRRLLGELRRSGIGTVLQAYRLGTLFHYLADACTYPHTKEFHGNIAVHNRYERALHRVFPAALRAADRAVPVPADPERFLRSVYASQVSLEHSPAQDAARIIRVCAQIWGSVFQESAGKYPILNKKS